MQKLLDRYLADPSDDNARRIAMYLRKHPFSAVILAADDRQTLAAAVDHFIRTPL